ncbi:hypothetical protein EDB80DRAFT_690898 [Ilyonectria destructans]|nr:hypothetical protein EDB80DRAFT_690898 [Ilyonectria destructans]
MAIGWIQMRLEIAEVSSCIEEADKGYRSSSDDEGDKDSPWDIQAGHGFLITGLVYRQLITEGYFETNERRVNFRNSSSGSKRSYSGLISIENSAAYIGIKPTFKQLAALVELYIRLIPTIEAIEALAEEFGYNTYYCEVDIYNSKAERLQVWMSGLGRDQYGEERVIVAINILSLGINIPDIRIVLYVEMPFKIADYIQQSGQAGRDRLQSEAIIVQVDIKADEYAAI